MDSLREKYPQLFEGLEEETNNMFLLPPGKFIGGDEYLLAECPECGKANHCYYNTEKQKGVCHSCKLVIRSDKHLHRLVDSFDYVDNDGPQRDYSSPIFQVHRGGIPSAWDVDEARAILQARGLHENDVRKVDIQWLAETEVMILPAEPAVPEYPLGYWYRALKGWPNKWIPRPETDTRRYGLGMKHIPAKNKHVLLVEGMYDILTPGLLGYAVTLFGTNLSSTWAHYFEQHNWKVSLWLDPDDAGRAASIKMKETFHFYGVEVVRDFVEEGFAKEREPGDLGRWDRRIIQVKEYLDMENNFELEL